MAGAITVGEALKQHFTEEETWDAPSEKRHNIAVDMWPELRWTLNQFLVTEEDHRHQAIRCYLMELDGSAPESFVSAVDTQLRLLAERTPDKKVSAGDKWVSPGRLVLTWPDLDASARQVLFVMAAHGNDKGENIFISKASIADYLDWSSSKPVQKAWRRLEKLGAIKQTAKPRQHRPSTWKINKGPRVI